MKPKLAIIKIGGNVIEHAAQLTQFLGLFAGLDGLKILVHGGGRKVTDLSSQLGIKAQMVGGRRITDTATLELAVMVYGGLVSKSVTARLQGLGCNAIGLCGADGNAIKAHLRPVKTIDYGWAGDIDAINRPMISGLLQGGLIPVFCALTHDGTGQLLNTNADTVASELAIGMSPDYETTLYYCFENKGVLKDRSDQASVITHINEASYEELLRAKIIADGMLPKMENCFHALRKGVRRVCIGDIKMLNSGAQNYTTVTL